MTVGVPRQAAADNSGASVPIQIPDFTFAVPFPGRDGPGQVATIGEGGMAKGNLRSFLLLLHRTARKRIPLKSKQRDQTRNC